MRIVILGANGQLGRDLIRYNTDHEIRGFTREAFDVVDYAKTQRALIDAQPEVVINTTAYHRVDDCEAQPEIAYAVNVLAVLNLCRVANEIGATLVHFSTDYVFDGKTSTPYTESSPPMPLSVYGNSKLSGEYIVRSTAARHLLIRTCGLYGVAGSRGKGGNFVETMLSKARAGEAIRVVVDQIVTPTHTADLARQVLRLLGANQSGLFHATNEGMCSWYEFACAVFELAGVKANISPTTSDQYRTPATRPAFSVLENSRLKALNLNLMQHWKDALAEYLREKSQRA
jgi:dTDP-4-dehydrorhamnose reductase